MVMGIRHRKLVPVPAMADLLRNQHSIRALAVGGNESKPQFAIAVQSGHGCPARCSCDVAEQLDSDADS